MLKTDVGDTSTQYETDHFVQEFLDVGSFPNLHSDLYITKQGLSYPS